MTASETRLPPPLFVPDDDLPVIWSPEWAPFLDIDGTLLDIAARPDDVFVPDRLIETLTAIADTCGCLALVTGRSLPQADALFGAGRFDVAANHGAVMRIGGVVCDQAGDPGAAEAMAAALRPAVDRHDGAFVEEKGHSVAVHYRAAPEAEPFLLQAAHEAIRGSGDAWRILIGKAVIEIAPQSATKGTAIARFLADPAYRRRRPFFAGDDTTDEDAFVAVAAAGGLGVLIGPERKTAARYRLPSPGAFRSWLDGSVAGRSG
ncbi:trehalose-phosphatase [Prosthecodimorpha staleyi]|uniref:Trehalose 6-phosphate phosphatase n=1 Tax=Prosthecodimorpha staleyi TaxID=2840188 RepID=A0A947D5E1_9HYPH|nr:trehalose-phosphatase [Prosthecodimorpha staleyi]MBT9291166.1 trehalose-phosphatase [Prosthecodimorpha staleyi]